MRVFSYPHRSVDLIEQLVRDVVSTTASYKQLQERESRLLSDFSSAQAQLFPLRKENSRLSRENQQLHMDSIQQKENAIVAIDVHKSELRGLEERLHEMKDLADAKERDYRNMEKERERMREVSRNLGAMLSRTTIYLKYLMRVPQTVTDKLPPFDTNDGMTTR